MAETFDMAVVGGGPAGIMAAFFAGTRGLKPIVIDILDRLGGQCATLYPEKGVYDVAGFPATTGAKLINRLVDQLDQIPYEKSLNTHIKEIKQIQDTDGKDIWQLQTMSNSIIKARTIVVAVGKGAFEPRKLKVPGEDLEGVFYTVQSLETFYDSRLLIVGGGDSAFDWCNTLKDKTQTITHIHRSDMYRAHGPSVDAVKAASDIPDNNVDLMPFWEIKEIIGSFDKKVKEVTIFNNKTKEEKTFEVDKIIISAGFLTNLGNLHNWDLEIDHEKIIVDPTKGYATNLPGIYAIGDIAHFEGKVELITTSFGEAATTAFYAFNHIHGKSKGAAWCAKLPGA